MIKHIFCISTGRCGTDYLKTLLETLDNTAAYHEQKPLLHHKIMRNYLNGDTHLLNKELPYKLARIKNVTNANKTYVDTSHIFIKSFGWELPKHIKQEEIGVIILKRNIDKVVQSTQRIHSGPYTYLGRKWIITPYKKPLLKPPISLFQYKVNRLLFKLFSFVNGSHNSVKKKYSNGLQRSSMKLLNWYYNETYALGEKYQKQFPNIKYVSLTIEELNVMEGFEKIIDTFKLRDQYHPSRVKSLLGKKRNLKASL